MDYDTLSWVEEKHVSEHVGLKWRAVNLESGLVKRDDMFLQNDFSLNEFSVLFSMLHDTGHEGCTSHGDAR